MDVPFVRQTPFLDTNRGNDQIQNEQLTYWGTGHFILAFLHSFTVGGGIGFKLLADYGAVIGIILTILISLERLEKRAKIGVLAFTQRTGIPVSANLQKKLK